MRPFLDKVLAAGLRRLDPETAHRAAISLLRHAPLPASPPDLPELAVEAFGLRFANPVGLAAGFDKNAEAVTGALRLGFGFTEVGTLTPQAQAGNERPRVFRLPADRAVINRYGFNNCGHEPALRRLERLPERRGIIGVNVGANKDAADRTADYLAGIERFAPVADYLALNVSSPNTPGLRDLQAAAALDDLLGRAVEARDFAGAHHGRKPLLLKIAPDLDLPSLDDIVRIARKHRIDGMIVSNTTVSRPAGLRDGKVAREGGGLSGRPLFRLATAMLAQTFIRVEGQFPLVGVGGIDSAASALDKIRAGATLIQLYSGLVYAGMGIVAEIKREIRAELVRTGGLGRDLVGVDAETWAAHPFS